MIAADAGMQAAADFMPRKLPAVRFGLMHFWIAIFTPVLCGGRRGDDRGIHNGPAMHDQAGISEYGAEFGKNLFTDSMLFQKMAEVKQCC